jgi:hypothetical protein
MKKILSSFFIFIFLFFFIYTPYLFFPANIIHLLTLYAILMLVTLYRRAFLKLIQNKAIKNFTTGMLIVVAYCFMIVAFTSQDFISLYGYSSMLLEVLPCSIFLSLYLKRHALNYEYLIIILLNVALLQALIAFIMFINPDIRALSILIQESNNKDFTTAGTLSYWSQLRMFGLANGYTFAMPVFQGVMASIALLFAFRKSSLYLLYIPPLLFSVMINARIGLIIFLACSLFVLIHIAASYKFRTLLKGTIYIFFILFLFFTFAMDIINYYSQATGAWLQQPLEIAQNIITGESEVEELFPIKEMTVFHGDIGIIIGTGKNIFGEKGGVLGSSDIGYINDLFFGGIITVAILYSTVLLYLFASFKKGHLSKLISTIMIISLFIANIKGSAFYPNEFFNAFILLATVAVALQPLRNKNEHMVPIPRPNKIASHEIFDQI